MPHVLSAYREAAIRRTAKDFPHFAPEAVHTAPFLALLQDPGKSGAVQTRVCSIDNPDPTAARQKRAIAEAGVLRGDIVFWNFCGAFDGSITARRVWAKEVEELIAVLPNLAVVLAFGNEAWIGMMHVRLKPGLGLIGAPHPSNRAAIGNRQSEAEIVDAWKRALAHIQ